MKCRKAFSLPEAALCIGLLGLLASFVAYLTLAALQAYRDTGNPLVQSKAMRALAIMDSWCSSASEIRPLSDFDSFDPGAFDSMEEIPENAQGLVFKIADGERLVFKALEVREDGFRIHSWRGKTGTSQYDHSVESSFLSLSGKHYESEIRSADYFGTGVLEQVLRIAMPGGSVWELVFMGKGTL